MGTSAETPARALVHRLRRLSRVERAVLFRASAIGRRFRVEVLSATTMLPEATVRAALAKAAELQLVVAEDADWFAFRHAVTRDVAYGQFVDTRMRPIHRRIALALERNGDRADGELDDLAYHSWAAGDAARCIRYNELAGDRATAVFAAGDARTYYARAREFAAGDSEQYRRLTRKLRALDIAD